MTIRRTTRDLWRNQRGIALPMVLIIFLIGFALVGAFMIAIVGSANVSNTTRAGIQAQAAAEAGLAAAQVVLPAASESGVNLCTNFPAGQLVGTSPKFEVRGQCNNNTSPTRLRITSTGTAPSGDQAVVEAVFEMEVTAATPTADISLRTSAGTGFVQGSNTNIRSTNPSTHPADLYVEKGNYTCTNGGVIQGSVYVIEGTADLSGNCKVWGNLYVKGDIQIGNSSDIGNAAIAGSGNVYSYTGSVTMSGSASTRGSVFAQKNFARTGSAKVLGELHIGGSLSLSGGSLPVIAGKARYVTTASPSNLSGWVGSSERVAAGPTMTPTQMPPFESLTVEQIKSKGFAEKVWTTSWSCTIQNWGSPPEIAAIEGYTTPTVLDARHCSKFSLEYWGLTLKLKTDVVIVSNAFHLRGFSIDSEDGAPHKIWFVVPSTTTNCVNPSMTLDSVKFPNRRITALAYSKCTIDMSNSGDYWHGAIYGNSFSGTPLLDFSPIGLPGATTTGGGGSGGKVQLKSPTPLTQRDVDVAM